MKKIITFLLVASVLVFSTTATYAASSRGRHWGGTSDTTVAEHRVCKGEGECTYPDCPKNQTQESEGTLCPNGGTPTHHNAGTGHGHGRKH
ncbi:MAG: hypothetical protein EOM34_04435 [Clostridia bacterium]|nr:hypothetical protein [Lachnospiraceae bacterium]NCB99916.1 hypothetical protein [Clostridia bacterium]NCD04029.1 hypothetical protein [Clostridia bacterium]